MIVHPALWGRWVEVLHAAPSGVFTLPDGFPAYGILREACWVCESLGPDFTARLDCGLTRTTRYGVIADHWLRPIRGDEPANGIATERERELSDA